MINYILDYRLRKRSSLPIIRLAFGMSNRSDPDGIRQFQVEDHKWKPLCFVFSKARLLVSWRRLRISSNRSECSRYLFEQVQTEPFEPGFIPRHGFVELFTRSPMDHQRFHMCLRRNSEKTFSAGSPLSPPLRMSPARRSSSSSQAVSASVSEASSSDRIRKRARAARSEAASSLSFVLRTSARAVIKQQPLCPTPAVKMFAPAFSS